MIWVPEGIKAATAAVLCTPNNLWARDRDGLADFRPVRLFLQHSGVRAPSGLAAFGASPVWSTVTPYAPPRHIRTDGRMLRSLHAQIKRDLAEFGKPAPTRLDLVSGPRNALDFRRHRVKNENLQQARRAFQVRLTFSESIGGPLSIGALSHFGLGHFLPSEPNGESLASFSTV